VQEAKDHRLNLLLCFGRIALPEKGQNLTWSCAAWPLKSSGLHTLSNYAL
jgi:hypothetical protein